MTLATNKKIRAAAYLRVSTDEQAKEGHYGLKVQEDKIRDYCKRKGYELSKTDIYTDGGYSGTLELEDRPAFQRLYESAREGQYGVVVVYKYDRLARKLDVSTKIRTVFKALKIDIESVSEELDQNTPIGDSMVDFWGWYADLERKIIFERTYSGRIRAAKEGKWITGVPPYAYRINKKTKKLEIVLLEEPIVQRFFHQLIYERLSLAEIARRANADGIPAPKHKTIHKKRKTYNIWYKRTIGRILTNEIYAGRAYFRKYKRPFNNLTSLIDESMLRPEEHWIPFDAPPIISADLFEAAKQQLIRNRENSARNMRHSYLYAKLLYCGYCNHRLSSGFHPPKTEIGPETNGKYYHGVYRKEDAVGTTKRCQRCDQYAEARLEPIWETLKEILQKPENLHDPLMRFRYKQPDRATIQKKIRLHEQEIEAIANKQRRLMRLFIEEGLGEMKELKKLQLEYEKEKRWQENEIAKLKQSIMTKKDQTTREEALKGLYKQIGNKLEQATYEDKRKLLHLFVERITLFTKSNYAEVVFKFPTATVVSATKIDTQGNVPLFLNIPTLPLEDARVLARKIGKEMRANH